MTISTAPDQTYEYETCGWSNTSDNLIQFSSSSSSTPTSSSHSFIGMYLSPPILLLGVVGNILTISVMKRRAFQNTTACVYLTLLGVFDTLLLVTGIFHEWLEWFAIDLDPWPCRFHRFFFYLSSDVSMWTIVLFTFDRFIAVCFPLRKRIVCRPRRAVVAFVVVSLIWIAKNLHVFWTRGEEFIDDVLYRKCGYCPQYANFEYYIRPWIVFVFILLLPFCIVLLLNCAIVSYLRRSRVKRTISLPSSTALRNPFRQTTVMCLCLSFTCLVCIAPSIVLVIGKPYWKSRGSQSAVYDIAKVVNNELVYFNHAINFCLYCITGQRFRCELIAMFTTKVYKGPGQGSITVTPPTKAVCPETLC